MPEYKRASHKLTVVKSKDRNYFIRIYKLDKNSASGWYNSGCFEIEVMFCHDMNNPDEPESYTKKSHLYDNEDLVNEAMARITRWIESR